MFGFRAPTDTSDAMHASFSSEALRVLIVLLQLAVSFIIGTVVIALWTGEAKDSWLHSEYRLLRSSFEFILSMASQGNVTSEARLGRATLADIAKEAVAANKDVEAPLGSEEHRPSRWQAAALSATSTDEQGAAAVSDVSKLRKIGSKSAANLNLGNLGDLQAKRRQEVFASIFERDFGLELSVAAAIGLAHWMHGRGLLDWLFLLLWATACVALVASRGRRLLLYAEARQGLAKVERATMQAEGELPRRLRDGTIRLVHVDWLLEHASALATSGGGIACHQDLPAEAFVPSAEALALLESTPGSLAALSYGWLSPAHPDPYGFHLRAVAAWLHKHGGSVRAIFWDWLSLPQRRPKVGRTTEEQARFQRSLEVMLHLYASPRVLVLQHKNMPRQQIFSDLFSEALNTRPYEKRGWCLVEQYTALSVNVRDKVADVARGYFVPASGNRVAPDELAELLEKAHFTGKADKELVIMLYEMFYATAVELDMALVDAGLDVVQSKPGKKSKPGRSGLAQARADLQQALRTKIQALVTARDDKGPDSRRGSDSKRSSESGRKSGADSGRKSGTESKKPNKPVLLGDVKQMV